MFSPPTEYALRALTYLAEKPAGSLLLNREISDELNLPQAFMHKVMKQLVNAGLLESARGKRGGFKLTRPANEITLFDISRLFDNLDVRDNCVLGQEICSDDVPCPMHKAWKKVMRDFLDAIKTTTLEDMAHFGKEGNRPYPVRLPARELKRLLNDRRKARGEAEEGPTPIGGKDSAAAL